MHAPAKLTRPRLHSVLRRARLFERLDELDSKPLTWISGPPGAGKTALVASYLDSQDRDHIWFQVDAGDGELATFFYYLGRTHAAERGSKKHPLPLFAREYRNDVAGYSRHYFRLLYDMLPASSAIVLDNYHELPPDAALHALLATAIEEAPEGVRWIVISRADPPRQFARLEASERLALVDSQMLALSPEETRDLLALRNCADAEVVQSLHRQCGGWAAGLVLTFERLRRLGSMLPSVVVEAKESVFNYFAQEVFASASEDERSLLVRAALLPRMTVEMVERLTENPRAEAILEHLYRRRLFLEKRRQIYQFHDLFRAFLLEKLKEDVGAEGRAKLAHRAAELSLLSGAQEDAFDLYCEAGDYASAERIFLIVAGTLLEQGRSERLRNWIAAMPRELVTDSAWLQYWLGMSLLYDDPPAARTPLSEAFRRFSRVDEREGRLLACSAMVLTYYFDYAEMGPLDPWVDAMLELVQELPVTVSPETELRAQLALLFALRHRRPERRLTVRCEARTSDLIGAECLPNTRMLAAIMLLAGYAAAGDVEQGARLVARMQKLADNVGVTPANRANWHMIAGHFLLMSGHVERAAGSFDRALAILEENAVNLEMVAMLARYGLGVCALDDDRIQVAQAHIDELVTMSERIRPLTEACANRLLLRIAMRRNDPDAALRHARVAHDYSSTAGTTMGLILDKVDVARCLVALGRFEEAATFLEETRALCTNSMFFRYGCLADLMLAYSLLRQDDKSGCHAALGRGLRQARLDAYCHTRFSYPEVHRALLMEAWKACIETDYAMNLIRQLRVSPPKGEDADWPWHIRILTLGRFEVIRDEKAIVFGRKLPQKPLQLLKALVAMGGSDVSEQRLSDALWPGESVDDGNNLQVTLNRLRKLLGGAETIRQSGGRLSLDPDLCWADAVAFEKLAGPGGNGKAAASAEKALELYRGGFLDGEEDAPWLIGTRERLRAKFVALIAFYGKSIEAEGNFDAAIALFQRGIEAEALAEELHRALMRCLHARGRTSDAMLTYRRLRQVLSVSLGIQPSRESQLLFEQLRA